MKGACIRVLSGTGGYVVLRDVESVLCNVSVSWLLDNVDLDAKVDSSRIWGRYGTVAVRGTVLAEILIASPRPAVPAFLAWARVHLFPLILGGSSMEEVEAILKAPFEKHCSLDGTPLFYDEGLPRAVLTEDPVTRRLWATALQIAAIFGTTNRNAQKHLDAIYAYAVLTPIRTMYSEYIVRIECGRSVRREVVFYDFEVISAVGDRVSTVKAAAFRRWRARLVEAHILGLDTRITELAERNAELAARLASVQAERDNLRVAPKVWDDLELARKVIERDRPAVEHPEYSDPSLNLFHSPIPKPLTAAQRAAIVEVASRPNLHWQRLRYATPPPSSPTSPLPTPRSTQLSP